MMTCFIFIIYSVFRFSLLSFCLFHFISIYLLAVWLLPSPNASASVPAGRQRRPQHRGVSRRLRQVVAGGRRVLRLRDLHRGHPAWRLHPRLLLQGLDPSADVLRASPTGRPPSLRPSAEERTAVPGPRPARTLAGSSIYYSSVTCVDVHIYM